MSVSECLRPWALALGVVLAVVWHAAVAGAPPRPGAPSAGVLQPDTASAQSSDELQARAAEAGRRGDWPEAVELLRRARSQSPRSVAILVDLAVALERVGQPVEAISAYREALAVDPGAVAAAEGLAALLAAREDLEGAVYVLAEAAAHRPEVGSLHYHLALLRFRQEQGLDSAAIASLERARELGFERPHLYLLLGRVTRMRQGAGAAVELLEHGLEQAPDDVELLREIGITRAALGDPDGAVAAFERALSGEPDNMELVAELARAYLQAGRALEARALLQRFEPEQSSDLLYLLARSQRALQDEAAAATMRRFRELDARERSVEAADARALARVRAGIVAWEEGDVAVAASHFEGALAERPEWPIARSYLATARLAQGRTEAAVELAEALLRTDPDNAQAMMVLGRVRLERSPEDALEILERAVRLYPFRTVCLLTLAEAYLRLGRTGDAQPLLDRAAKIDPDDPWIGELRDRSRS